jgi:hypothetical protein
MNEYTHPSRDLQGALARSHRALYVLGSLLALSIVAVPWILRQGPVVVMDQDGYSHMVRSKPWQLTVSRMEGFTRLYLLNRWEWSPEDFDAKRASLEELVVPTILPKLKDSLQGLSSLSKAQQARSYFVLEGWGFSNADHKIEARIDRVIRIKSAAVATPMTVRLIVQEAPVTESNPYGLKIESLEEAEAQEGAGS